MKSEIQKLQSAIRRWLLFFMIGLVVSGATAFDLPSGLAWTTGHISYTPVRAWLLTVNAALADTAAKYPFLFYGYDWLAFAHLVIAVAFIGPYRNAVQNQWVIEFGMIACAMVIPAALVMGAVRHVPFWWRLLDGCFGLFGFIPLAIVWWKI